MNSSTAASPPPKKQPLPLCSHSWTCPTTMPSQLRLLGWQSDNESSLSPPHRNPLSVSLSELNQPSKWPENCGGNDFYEVAVGCQTDWPLKSHRALWGLLNQLKSRLPQAHLPSLLALRKLLVNAPQHSQPVWGAILILLFLIGY